MKSCRTCFKFYCMFYFTCDRSLIVIVLTTMTGHLADVALYEHFLLVIKSNRITSIFRPTVNESPRNFFLKTYSKIDIRLSPVHQRRDSTRQLTRVGVGGVYWALQTDLAGASSVNGSVNVVYTAACL